MAPASERDERAASWHAMLDHARTVARGWVSKGRKYADDVHDNDVDGDEPRVIRRNIGPVQFARKLGKVGAR